MSETVDRFLREIGERLPPERIAALYLFPPRSHGPVETGVAVIAMEPEAVSVPLPVDGDEGIADGTALQVEAPTVVATSVVAPERHMIVTARYCATLKGVDRGKWEFGLAVEADAPILTLQSVVRGVQRRVGDDAEPLQLSRDAVRATRAGVPWAPTI